MKIDDMMQKVSPIAVNEVADKKPLPEPIHKDILQSPAQDRVNISQTSTRMNNAMTIDDAKSVRSDRVAMLKSLIESGEYHVSGQAVAEKMLAMRQRSY